MGIFRRRFWYQRKRRDLAWSLPAGSGAGSLSQTLGMATLSATGEIALAGALSKSLDAATLVSAGTIGATGVGSLSKILDDATLVATGQISLSGSFVQALAPAALIATSTISITGELSATLGTLRLSASNVVVIPVVSPRLRYTPTNPVSVIPETMWAYMEFLRISQALEDVRQSLVMRPQAGPVERVTDGMLMQADGSVWNPGQGAGLYQYLDGSWVKLRGGLASDEAFYFGNTTTAGSWRIIRNGDDLEMQRYEGGSWVMKQRIDA